MQSCEKKLVKKNFKSVVKQFLQGHFEAGLNKLNELNPELLTKKDFVLFKKVSHIYFLGQLLGLPTLHSILTYYGIKSNSLRINLNTLNTTLSRRKVIEIHEKIFQNNARQILEELLSKDSSVLSKKSVTIVIDDSIFKQWLQDLIGKDPYYGCFFSGQYHSKQYGFKVCCLGVSIADVFYPLFLDFVPKKISDERGKNTELTAEDVAMKLIKKWAAFYQTLQKPSKTPLFYLSCDSGYSSIKISKMCKENDLIYISVPKKSHLFKIDKVKKKLSDFVIEFEEKEKIYFENYKAESIEPDAYTWRVEATYCSQDINVILLFFRLNGSNKVSIIYTTHINILKKTLRRHWFDRTYIEQFFKLLKHSMKIQNSIIRSKEGFENKLYQFMSIAFYLQTFVRCVRKKIDFEVKQKIGLEGIKRQPLLKECVDELLQQILQKNSHN